MTVLGIETSCDECAAAIVRDGKTIISNVIRSQIPVHAPYNGVVPELASRMHTEWIYSVVSAAFSQAGMNARDMDGIAVTVEPGLVGSLLVGLSFAKGLALTLDKPLIGINHIKAHLYAPQLEYDVSYPYLGLIVSGGHTILALLEDYDNLTVLGATIDDACGEAFDKVAKNYGFGYPGGMVIEKLAERGSSKAFSFPFPSLHKGPHPYDFSYSGLKTAVINQLEQFRNPGYESNAYNIAASFQKAAVQMLLSRVKRAVKELKIDRIAAGGGVAANNSLREGLLNLGNVQVYLPSKSLCTDNAAMVAGLGYRYLMDGVLSPLSVNVQSRVPGFRKAYP